MSMARERLRRLRRRARRWTVALVGVALLGHAAERVSDVVAPYPLDGLRRYGHSVVYHDAAGDRLRVTPTTSGERLLHVSIDDVSPHLIDALVAVEDQRFETHVGVDPVAVVRASIRCLLAGRVVSGASTLSMQVARLGEPHPRSLGWKLWEMWRARQLERRLSKREILEAYVNTAPLGGNVRGFEAASWVWFGKGARDLGPEEAATLVAMLPAPTRRAPDAVAGGVHIELLEARDEALRRMHRAGRLTGSDLDRALATPIVARRRMWPYRAPHACDAAQVADGAERVHLDIELPVQTRLERAVRHWTPAEIDGVAAIVVARDDGRVVARVGSADYRAHPLDTTRTRRSVGSTLKPFLYALALERGVTGLDTGLADTPLELAGYRPENFEQDHRGRLRAADALTSSRNLPAIRLLARVGPDRFRELLRELGLPVTDRPLHLDAALGTLAATPEELARAYRRFAGDGSLESVRPELRARVLDALADRAPASFARAGAVAWKTGTSSDRRDAWCVGVTDEHVVVAWLGRLDGRSDPQLVGARVAAPIVAAFTAGRLTQ